MKRIYTIGLVVVVIGIIMSSCNRYIACPAYANADINNTIVIEDPS